ncbi:hypothetical protein ANS017_11610 [Paraclostridium bifermentans]|nr:hypothetical protein ANS014_14080 [Paraclostridium bifermentans]GKZ07268.1 hypothetical protein ANS015_21510 [Paraclostridium bifermentans]GKZ09777.1 hypothetical protein ANS017_11610 [Paraclostridium bifermentans]
MKNKILEVVFDVQKRLKRVNKKLYRVDVKLTMDLNFFNY